MKDNITFSKIWEDGDIIELKVVCSSSVATITSQIYVSDSLIDELICKLSNFLMVISKRAYGQTRIKEMIRQRVYHYDSLVKTN